MKLLTTPHDHKADGSSAVKAYHTHTITAKLSFTPTSSAAPTGGGFLKQRRQSHGGETTTDELASDMEYIFDGKLTVEEVSPPQES